MYCRSVGYFFFSWNWWLGRRITCFIERTPWSEKNSWRDLIMVKILLNTFILLKRCQDINLSLLFRRKPRSKLREERDIKCSWMRWLFLAFKWSKFKYTMQDWQLCPVKYGRVKTFWKLSNVFSCLGLPLRRQTTFFLAGFTTTVTFHILTFFSTFIKSYSQQCHTGYLCLMSC